MAQMRGALLTDTLAEAVKKEVAVPLASLTASLAGTSGTAPSGKGASVEDIVGAVKSAMSAAREQERATSISLLTSSQQAHADVRAMQKDLLELRECVTSDLQGGWHRQWCHRYRGAPAASHRGAAPSSNGASYQAGAAGMRPHELARSNGSCRNWRRTSRRRGGGGTPGSSH